MNADPRIDPSSANEDEDQPHDPLHEEVPDANAAPPTLTSNVDSLHLAPEVAAKARQLQQAAPNMRFTSGRRDLVGQARAMAGNVVSNRHWIEQTYVSTSAIRALQHWVDTHPAATSADVIAEGLLQVLQGLSEAHQMSISRHLVGRAFDVQPNSCSASAIQALHPRKFLQHEGGKTIWHVGF